jgi:hypothetical protein
MTDVISHPRRRRVLKPALVAALLLLPAPAFGWGAEGHEVVAHLAALNLTPRARQQVAALLGGEAEASMAIASNWADEIRDARPETSTWHFVNLEIEGDGRYRPARDCPGGNCVVAQILQHQAILAGRASGARKAEALKFLIHLVGDIHQPLHAGENHDRGGNMVGIATRRGGPTNLHHFWDDDLVVRLGRNPATVARGIDRAFSRAQKTRLMASASPVAWAEESAAIARSAVYPQIAGSSRPVLADRAIAQDAAIARQRLAKAGYALAGLLNRLLR